MARDAVATVAAIKGLLAAETHAVLAGWDLSRGKSENLRNSPALRACGSERLAVQRAKALSSRLEIPGRDAPLVALARRGWPPEHWKPPLLWHLAEGDRLIRWFLEDWLFPRRGAERLNARDLRPAIVALRGAPPLGADTVEHVAGALFKIAVDAELMTGSVSRRFRPFRLSDPALLYMLHALAERHAAARRIIEAPDWRRFLMTPAEVEHELFRLHQFRVLDYQVAGSLAQLTLPRASLADFAEGWEPWTGTGAKD
ncbi:MAG: DUF1819 domain-containing protein [Alphaproteobacteria bacterium]|nr:DUF1819 domain-containing protein [Alphaproteobacteria bacterium]